MDRKLAEKMLSEFVKNGEAAHGYAYTTGFMFSAILDLLEQVPPDVCMKVLNNFASVTPDAIIKQ
jgi:hypothetical protein